MDGNGKDYQDSSDSHLLREITELKRSNERLERAFVALSQTLQNQQHILNHLTGTEPESHGPPQDTLRKEFERKLKRGRASIVKDKILAHLDSHGPVQLSDLKFLFVDQLRYTSKASFYRYVSDLTDAGKLAQSEVEGTTIVSLAGPTQQH